MPEFELSDDGEFAEPVDSSYGVYSARRSNWRFPMLFALSSVFACALIMALYVGFSS